MKEVVVYDLIIKHKIFFRHLMNFLMNDDGLIMMYFFQEVPYDGRR